MKRLTIAVFGALCLMLGGCGGSDDGGAGGVASGANSQQTEETKRIAEMSDEQKRLAFAECVRQNGVPDFQDSDAAGGLKIDGQQDPAKADAVMQAAQKCRKYMPGQDPGGKGASPRDVENVRKYAECMRENGVADFPDPDSEGRITVNQSGGFDLMAPAVKVADQKCAPLKANGK
jgi:hypothetical protein